MMTTRRLHHAPDGVSQVIHLLSYTAEASWMASLVLMSASVHFRTIVWCGGLKIYLCSVVISGGVLFSTSMC